MSSLEIDIIDEVQKLSVRCLNQILYILLETYLKQDQGKIMRRILRKIANSDTEKSG
jgi:hypothetical protein